MDTIRFDERRKILKIDLDYYRLEIEMTKKSKGWVYKTTGSIKLIDPIDDKDYTDIYLSRISNIKSYSLSSLINKIQKLPDPHPLYSYPLGR